MRFPYPIWLETGRKGVVDGGADRVLTGGDGGMAFCGLGCRKAVKEERNHFWGITWCCWCSWLGLRSFVSAGRRRGRAAAEQKLAGAAGDDVRARKNEIGWAEEHQWITAVL
jgi:hypothetical protein